ncbi:hypothetical protein [Paralimibaculum aggregatum]|uniref:hypothetical protein n=1 Tax=Paralimibaculum aggregatum TaxID=3036245 RepID=UPI002554949D|nr:hypothetical protein [Limibaculum sp. NKW23]
MAIRRISGQTSLALATDAGAPRIADGMRDCMTLGDGRRMLLCRSPRIRGNRHAPRAIAEGRASAFSGTAIVFFAAELTCARLDESLADGPMIGCPLHAGGSTSATARCRRRRSAPVSGALLSRPATATP